MMVGCSGFLKAQSSRPTPRTRARMVYFLRYLSSSWQVTAIKKIKEMIQNIPTSMKQRVVLFSICIAMSLGLSEANDVIPNLSQGLFQYERTFLACFTLSNSSWLPPLSGWYYLVASRIATLSQDSVWILGNRSRDISEGSSRNTGSTRGRGRQRRGGMGERVRRVLVKIRNNRLNTIITIYYYRQISPDDIPTYIQIMIQQTLQLNQRSTLDWLLDCDYFTLCDRFNPCLITNKDLPDLSMFLNEFIPISHYDDPYFGRVYLLEHMGTVEFVVMRKEEFNYADVCDEIYYRYLQKRSLRNNNIVNILEVSKRNSPGLCSTDYTLYVFYEYIFIDLLKEFDYRLNQLQQFTEEELMLILTQCVNGLAYLECRKVSHAAIRMDNIYISKIHQMKVGYKELFNYVSNYDLVRTGNITPGVYLSPEELACLGRRELIPSCSEWKSSAFSFGMVMLSLMCFHHLEDIYDYWGHQINRLKLDTYLTKCKTQYSQRLVNIITWLTASEPQRITFQGLYNKLMLLPLEKQGNFTILNEAVSSYSPFLLPVSSQKAERDQYGTLFPNYLAQFLYPNVNANTTIMPQSYQKKPQNFTTYLKVPQKNRIIYHNGNQFTGQGMNDGKLERNGMGLYRFADGQYFIGDWMNNKMHGHGLLYWFDNQIRYEGDFVNDQFHGKGVQFPRSPPFGPVDYRNITLNNNWTKYEGNYVRDVKHGPGVITFLNGNWKGNFKEGQPDGEGEWYEAGELPIRGIWRQGILDQGQVFGLNSINPAATGAPTIPGAMAMTIPMSQNPLQNSMMRGSMHGSRLF